VRADPRAVGALGPQGLAGQASVDAQRVESATVRSVLAIVDFSLRDGIKTVEISSQLNKLMDSYAMLACNGLHSECQLLQMRTCTRCSMLMPIQMFARALSEAGESPQRLPYAYGKRGVG